MAAENIHPPTRLDLAGIFRIFTGMKILIRLPNWLGDMVMSTAFVKAVGEQWPGAQLDLVAKKGIDVLLDAFPAHGKRYIFSKDDYPGLAGPWRFGKKIRREENYDLYFSLPDSFSSALMGWATGARQRIGFRKEGRGLFLTHVFNRPQGLHRVEEYMALLESFTGKKATVPSVRLRRQEKTPQEAIVININSEAVSRRLPRDKAIRIIDAMRSGYRGKIFLAGGPNDAAFVDEVYQGLLSRTDIVSIAGFTGIPELAGFLEGSRLLLSTDSGPAHMANALGTHSIVLFGAGNEKNTAPYNKELLTLIRYGQLDCEPCTQNTCRKYGSPKCLELLDEIKIMEAIKNVLKDE